MSGISDKADFQLGSGNMGQSDGAAESLILLWVVVLETDLELEGFLELSVFLVLLLSHGPCILLHIFP